MGRFPGISIRLGSLVARLRGIVGGLGRSPEQLLTILAVVIGLVTGLWAIGFSALIELVQELCFGHAGRAFQRWGLYVWLLPLLPMSGGLLVGLITYYFAPEAEGHGVPEVMDAMARKGCRIRPRVAGAKAVASALTIGSGGSAGTEGPIIQIGAAIGSGIGQRLNLGLNELRVLIGCGTAAGIASIFNAPIAGVLFAIEVLLRDVSLRSFLPIILSSVASSTITQAVRGTNDPIFPVPTQFMSHEPVYAFSVAEVGNYAVLGVLCGLVAWAFIKLLYFTEDRFRDIKLRKPLKPVLGAALLALAALGTEAVTRQQRPSLEAGPATRSYTARHAHHQPVVMGNGYPTIGQSLDPGTYGPVRDGAPGRPWSIRVLLILLAAKLVVTCLTLGSGGSGGVFAPSLFMGAMTGGAFGLLCQQTGWFPGLTPGAYALVGMAAVVAASIHAPLTGALMLFELTGDYKVIIPIMLAGVIALVVSQKLEPASIYTLKLLRRGVDIYRGQDISILRHLSVRDAMRSDPVTVPPGAGVMQIISRFVEYPGTSIFVVDPEQRLLGVIAGSQTRSIMADAKSFEPFIIAQDLMQETGFPTVSPNDTLADVMRRLANYRGEVPVVEGDRLVGAIWPEDVIAHYNAELFKRDMASSMAATVRQYPHSEPLPTVEDTSIAEVPVPPRFVGHSLASLDIRNRFGVSVLLIKNQDDTGGEVVHAVPSAGYVFRPGDVLLVMGPDENLKRLARGETPLPSASQT